MITLPKVPAEIETERLIIRCPKVTDVVELHAAVHESLAELSPWMNWATPAYSLPGAEQNTRAAIAAFITRKDLRYHFHDKQSGIFLGSSGLHRIDWHVPKFEIGYWVRSSKAGQGYVTETVRALTHLAFGQFMAVRVEIRCDERNFRSYRLAESCGFALEGTLKNEARAKDGSLRSTCIYALTELSDLK